MAIQRVSGNILQDNLQRGANLSIQGNLAFFDVTNSRVGILTTEPQDEFDVIGVANASNVRITSATANGIFYAGITQLALTTANLTWDGTVLNVVGNISAGNIIAGDAIVGNVDVGNITVSGNISVESLSANLFVTAVGNITGGNLISNAGILGATANITGNTAVGNILTDGYYYANGAPIDLQQPAGANTQIQYNFNSDFGASANLTYDQSTGIFQVGYGNSGTIQTNNLNVSNIATVNDGSLVFTIDGNGVASFVSTTSVTIPAGNTAQRPASPETGALRFNTGLTQVEVWDGSQWEVVGSDFVSITSQTINGDGSTDTFALNETTTAAAIIVATNGVVQQPDVAYTVTGNSITFAEAPQISDTIDVRFTAAVTYVNAITNLSGNAEITVSEPGVANIATCDSLQLPGYTVASAANISTPATGQVIYVTNGDSGNPCLAVYSGGAWKRVSLGANISA
jgi:hypothetical protein